MEHVRPLSLPPVTLVLGGARSGKSSHAEKLAAGTLHGGSPHPAVYIATAQAGDDDFANPLALDRVQLASWKLFLYGSDAVGGFPNDAVLGKVIGLRDRMRTGLAQAVAVNASVPPAQLNAAQQAAAFHALDADFRDLVVELTLQALWSAPEYGGNTALGGWTLVHYEGDVGVNLQHVGVLVGRSAHERIWPQIFDWLDA